MTQDPTPHPTQGTAQDPTQDTAQALPQDTMEQRILEAAKQLFFEHGFAGTSTTDIARLAGCNQALVHYYYRTKENLFRRIFVAQTRSVLDAIKQSFAENMPFEALLRHCVSFYFDFLTENPNVPYFILNELINNPERRAFIRDNFLHDPAYYEVYTQLEQRVEEEIAAGRIVRTTPQDIVLNMISLTAFSFISKPLYQDLLNCSEADCAAYLSHRRDEVIRVLLSSLKP